MLSPCCSCPPFVPQSFKERRCVHHTKEIMSGSPSFAELEKARKLQKGKCQPQGCDFQIPFGCPAGTGQSPNLCDTNPAAAAVTSPAKSQAEARSSITRALRRIRARPEKGKKGGSSKFCGLLSECALVETFGNYPLGLQMLPQIGRAHV